ncbi:MAG TPA: hypothetical protein VKX17_08220 [Planctomycetota bacterium]|nr:hypothetical protein [Planctomycetota bacterium]
MPTPRAKFQFHLSTLLIVMLSATVLLGLNVRGTHERIVHLNYDPDRILESIVLAPGEEAVLDYRLRMQGWPFAFREIWFDEHGVLMNYSREKEHWPLFALLDLLIALAYLYVTYRVSEKLYRSRTNKSDP